MRERGRGQAPFAGRHCGQRVLAVALVAAVAACTAASSEPSAPSPDGTPSDADREHAEIEARLLAFEESQRAAADFEQLARADDAHGADPYRLLVLGSDRVAGLLRGSSRLSLMDAQLRPLAELATPRAPTSLTLGQDGVLLVGSELEARLGRYRLAEDNGSLVALEPLELHGLGNTRVVASVGARWVVADEASGKLLVGGDSEDSEPREFGSCAGPTSLVASERYLVAGCLLERAVDVYPTAGELGGKLRISHDGPVWGVATVERGDSLWLALGGVEDRPLDRSIGSFGNIDSFLFVYERTPAGALERRLELNVAEHGVVTPRALALRFQDEQLVVDVLGYGSAEGLRVTDAGGPAPQLEELALEAPGAAAVARLADGSLLVANPLMDSWQRLRPDGKAAVTRALDPGPRHVETRVGEALFFSTLMAPFNRSQGKLSRFTCETCHFEGYGDGRVHFTGRGSVHASTKPLLSLFSNRPHFSRALDPNMARMVVNEFRVAGSGSDTDPWFDADLSLAPWLEQLGVEATMDAESLRRSLMRFLMAFNHRPNPLAVGQSELTAEQQRGAELFEQRCEACHQARLLADDPTSRVPPSRWQELVLNDGAPLVWGSDGYHQTGVEPYVHEEGARTPSLRRLYKKRPYFTNGSAPDLETLVRDLRFPEDKNADAAELLHAGEAPGLRAPTSDEQDALLAWLRLL